MAPYRIPEASDVAGRRGPGCRVRRFERCGGAGHRAWVGARRGRGSRRPSRDIPREICELPAPAPQAGYAATGKGDTPRKSASRRPLALSLGALLLASVAGGGYLTAATRTSLASPCDAMPDIRNRAAGWTLSYQK